MPPDLHKVSLVVTSEHRLRQIIREEMLEAAQAIGASYLADREMKKDWLANKEAMSEFGFSRSTLARYRSRGKLPFSKQGSLVFYRRADIESMLQSGLRRQTGTKSNQRTRKYEK